VDSDRLADALWSELRVFDGLSMTTGTKRIKRYAQQQTYAAQDPKGGDRPSWAKRSLACSTAVVSPPVYRRIKSKGYDMEP
jgi:hypothetical protein